MYMYFEANAVLYILTAFVVLIFLLGIYANLFLIFKGKSPSFYHTFKKVNALKALFSHVCLQKQILAQSGLRWIMHLCIFYGFLGLFLHTTILFLTTHFVPPTSPVSQFIFQGKGKLWLDLWGDFFGTALLVGLIIASLRRYVFKDKQLDTITTDTIALLLLFGVVLTGFISEAFRLAKSPLSWEMAYSFLGILLSLPLRFVSIPFGYLPVLWCHIIISLIFIAYIPYSKLWHIFVTPLEILFDASLKEEERKYERT